MVKKYAKNPVIIAAVVCCTFFGWLVNETVGSSASDLFVKYLGHSIGVSPSRVTAMIASLVIPGIVMAAIFFLAYKMGLAQASDPENVRVKLNTQHSALKILFGDTPPFDVQKTFQNGTKQRFVYVGVHNEGDGLLTNCEVFVRSSWPTWHQSGDVSVLLERGFDLHSGQTRYVGIASFGEFFSATQGPGDKITICMPPSPGYNAHLFLPVDLNPQKSAKKLITVEVKSADTHDCQVDCYLWVDHRSHGVRLRLEKA